MKIMNQKFHSKLKQKFEKIVQLSLFQLIYHFKSFEKFDSNSTFISTK